MPGHCMSSGTRMPPSNVSTFEPRNGVLLDPFTALRVVGLSGGQLIRVAREQGLAVAEEVFADRRYDAQKNLVSRKHPHACIEDLDQALHQVLLFVEQNKVQTMDGQMLGISADTICVHGDGKHALALAQLIRETLRQRQIAVRAPDFQP